MIKVYGDLRDLDPATRYNMVAIWINVKSLPNEKAMKNLEQRRFGQDHS